LIEFGKRERYEHAYNHTESECYRKFHLYPVGPSLYPQPV